MRNKFQFLNALIFLLLPAAMLPATAQVTAKIGRLEKEPPESPMRMELSRVQIFLDRANFRPGKIDGLGGEFTQKAADRYCVAKALPAGTLLDVSGIASPYREYTVTEEDQRWIGRQAATPAEQEKLKAMLYANLWELVAERFHCDLNFLRELNPGISQVTAGTVLRVPDVEEFKMADVEALEKQRRAEEKVLKAARLATEKAAKEIKLARLFTRNNGWFVPSEMLPVPEPPKPPELPLRNLVLLREERLIEVHEAGKMIACFPCTPGSSRVPVPVGAWRVTANILLPYFRWDKSVLDRGIRSNNAYNLPPGPNNPVGIVWIAINRPSIGMHGTQSPDQIGRNQSSGCIRLANWDAFLLSQLVGKGTPLEVR